MEIKPEHEFFGREIEFKDIQGIKKVFQPGILNPSYFFNPISLKESLSELCGYNPRDILVYFNSICAGIVSNKNEKRKWWETFQVFTNLLGNHFPAGCELEYWYGPDGKEFSLPEFKEDNPPYQAFVRLFNDAIQGFSCFVSQNPNVISFSSTRCNYYTIKPGEGFVHDQKSLWTGKSDIFLESAQILHNAFFEIERRGYLLNKGKYSDIEETAGINRRSEIRIICPERGVLVGSLYRDNSITLLLENSSLEKIAREHMEFRDRPRKRFSATSDEREVSV